MSFPRTRESSGTPRAAFGLDIAICGATRTSEATHERASMTIWRRVATGSWVYNSSILGAADGRAAYSVYITASRRNGTLYIGVTNNLAWRAHQHRTGAGSAFTTKYRVRMLVWCEHHFDVNEAIAREKQLKHWERRWKLELIEATNPDWQDLYERSNARDHAWWPTGYSLSRV